MDWDLDMSFTMVNLDDRFRSVQVDLYLEYGCVRWSILLYSVWSRVVGDQSIHVKEMWERMCQPYKRGGHY